MRAHNRLEEAADWWLRLRESSVPPETIAEWMHWCDAAPENLAAFESVQSLWQKSAAAPLKPVSDPLPRSPGEGKGGGIRWAIAAGLAALAISAWYLLIEPRTDGEIIRLTDQGDEAATPVGRMEDLSLPDGSRVKLGGASTLSTAFTANRREVRLERGEAFFIVRKDGLRPFVVTTPSATVTAVGTAFNVRTDGGVLKVTVTEGVVAVGAARLGAGEQATLEGPASQPAAIRKVDPGVATSWTTGTLKFMDEPLGSVVAAVNRYSPTTIELEREGLEGLRYTGTVVADRIDEWLAALPNAFPVEIMPADAGHVRIEALNR